MTLLNEDHLWTSLLSATMVGGATIGFKLLGWTWRQLFGEGHRTILVKQFGKMGEYEIHQDNHWYGTYYHVYKWQMGGPKITLYKWFISLESAIEHIGRIEDAINKVAFHFPKS